MNFSSCLGRSWLATFVSIVLSYVAPIACADISQFVESFDGVGDFGMNQTDIDFGLDNPDWLYFTLGGSVELQSDGLQFSHIGIDSNSLEGETSNISRNLLPELRSFVERVEIKDLDLGIIRDDEHGEATSGILFTHIVGFAEANMSISLNDSIVDDSTNSWLLAVQTDRSRELHVVPKSDHLALEMLFDVNNLEVYFRYDADLRDNLAPLEFGPLEFERHDIETPHRTKLLFGASGGSNRKANGLLDFWSLTKLVIPGDYDDDHLLTVADVDRLMTRVREGPFGKSYDLNDDGTLNSSDVRVWVRDLKGTFLGDANLDDEFNSTDLVAIFAAGEYEDGLAVNSTWATGDWNADAEFDSGDLVFAFAGGGYEFGPRTEASAIPEPTSFATLLAGLIVLATVPNTRRKCV